MRYLKLFEEWENNQIWKIPNKNKEEYVVALDKIGMPEKEINRWVEIIKPGQYDYILVHLSNSIKDDWTWSNITATDFMGNKYIDNPNYQGEVKVTTDDIEIYNLKKETGKYNL